MSPTANRTCPCAKAAAGRQRPAFEDCRHARELVGGRLGPVEIASGNLDLDLRLEERRTPEVRNCGGNSFEGTLEG